MMTSKQPKSYVQYVPGHCDRIVWRGSYYMLPLPSPPSPVETSAPIACIQRCSLIALNDDNWKCNECKAVFTRRAVEPKAKRCPCGDRDCSGDDHFNSPDGPGQQSAVSEESKICNCGACESGLKCVYAGGTYDGP